VLVFEADAALSEADGRVLGGVPFVPADRVDLLVLLGAERVSVLRDGIERVPLRGAGLRAAGASELRLGGARVVASWRSAPGARRALARARLYAASLLVGVLRAAAEFSREYALSRVAFGRPIAHHQALAFLIADMRSAVDGARLLVHEAAWHADEGLPFETLAAAAFAEAIEVSTFVGPNGIQILGGHGFMQDYPVEKYAREARALGLALGGSDGAREEAGRALAASAPPLALSSVEGG
jgi:alkylation response protein AidB-like acyl-CoA dehydrogenase